MKNGLLRKIGTGIVLPLAFVLSSCGIKTYEIDGNKVQWNTGNQWRPFEPCWVLKETTKKGDVNKYFFENDTRDKPFRKFEVKGEKPYFEKDTLVFSKAKEREKYLFQKIDSMEEAKRQERINYGLKALK